MRFLNGPVTRITGSAIFACVVMAAFFAATLKIGKAAPQNDTLWQTNYKQALEQAAKQRKNILLHFTGSDWCPYCIQMDKEVLSKPEFETFAAENLVLVKLDFPRSKRLPPGEREQNNRLGQQFSIEGFPTYILLDSTGKEVKRQVGYLEGGPKVFIRWARVGS
jgi:thioredoxin-related protein